MLDNDLKQQLTTVFAALESPVTLVYDQMFNQAGGPWFQMFTTAVYDGNMNLALQQGQSGLTRLLQQAAS